VVLSNVSISPGEYSQLRLVLKDNSSIKVDGEVFDIKIPSGEQSGLKLNGPFNIVYGKLFRLDLDFVAEESVLWTKGQGYKLKPVIKISNTAEIIGIFKSILDKNGHKTEILVEMYSDNTFKMKYSEYKEHNITGNFEYNSILKKLKFINLKYNIKDIDSSLIDKVDDNWPKDMEFDVKEWAIDRIITIYRNNTSVDFYRVDTFEFSSEFKSTSINVTVNYPDSTKNGKTIVVELTPYECDAPKLTGTSLINNNSCSLNFEIVNNYFKNETLKYYVSSYLFSDLNNLILEAGENGGVFTPVMSNSKFDETSNNTWNKNASLFEIKKDIINNIIINFPKKLNIKLTPNDFTTNTPIISWDSYPNANNGYLVLVLVKDRRINLDDGDGSNVWDIAFSKVVTDNSVKLFSEKYIVMNPYPIENPPPTPITTGDLVRIEIYVLDGSGTLDTENKTGALFMDCLNIIR